MAWAVGAGGGHPALGVCTQCEPTYFFFDSRQADLPKGTERGDGGGIVGQGWGACSRKPLAPLRQSYKARQE